ncbi:type IV secretory system conjugative DNA transfer family protein [Streptomyces rhizosphaericus]|uniref:type IV secretory system conjugative DNA transfer family protein n=1 Tax=Streptomyces rhizosphaericus TaxID=114699 RepID=UPI000A3A9FE1|nr:type IV secretory system conjugative DNA transfer family protein [Streptomyces rhizosphaericus]
MAAGQNHGGPAEHGGPPSAERGIPDGLLIGAIALLLGTLGLMWSATGLSGLFARGAWPDNLTFMRAPVALRHLLQEPQDLAAAWPDTPKDQLSGYGLFWGIFISELMVLIVLTIFVMGTLARYRTVRAQRRVARATARANAAEAKRLGLKDTRTAKDGTAPPPVNGTGVEAAPGVEVPPPPAPSVTGPGSVSAAPGAASPRPSEGSPGTAAPDRPSGLPAPGPTETVPGDGAIAPAAGHRHPTEAIAAEASAGTGPEPYPHITEQRAAAQDAPTGSTTTPPAQDDLYAPLDPTSAPQPLPTPRSGPLTSAARPDGELARSRVLFGAQRGESAAHTVLEAVGPVLVVTSDPKLWTTTKDARAKLGPTHVFDPSHLLDTPARLRWNPAVDCGSRDIAAARATALLAPVRPMHAMDRPLAEAAETMLRCWLHAAAVDGRPFRHVHRWAQGSSAHEPVKILRTHPKAAGGAAGELEATLTAHRERRDMAQELTARALGALSSIHIRDACNPGRADTLAPESFVAEGGTLYLMGESIEDPRTQPGAMPLLTALASHVVEHGRRMAERSSSGRLDPPLTLVLDDVAAVAPLPALPDLLAQGADQGLPTLALMRSQEQARARWPHRSLAGQESH